MSEAGSTAEKRKYTRHVVENIEVRLADNDELLGRVINLSLGGMLILHTSKLEVNKRLSVRIPLDHSTNKLSDLETDVKVRWFNRGHSSGLIGFGLEFTDDSEEKLNAIQGIIDEFTQV